MKQIGFFLLVVVALFACSEKPTEAPVDAIVNAPEQTGGDDFGPMGKAVVNWNVSKYFNKGDQAQAYWYDQDFYASFYVSRDVTNNSGFLSYYVEVAGQAVENGYGNIPAADLTGSYADGWLDLQTNTSAASNPNFYLAVGNGGEISAYFQKTADYFFEQRGYVLQHIPLYQQVYAFKGQFSSRSAPASGSLIGYAIGSNPWPGGHQLGEFKNLNVFISYGN
jgi:hypothetical protein